MLAQKRNAGEKRLSRFALLAALLFCLVVHSLCMVTPAAAQEEVAAPIYVNQVGYGTHSAKIAVVSAPLMLPFSVVETQSQAVVFASQLQLHEAYDAASGAQAWTADFSAMDATGEYVVRVPGLGDSFPFRVMDKPFGDLRRDAARVFYGMRYGLDLSEDHADEFARPSPQFMLEAAEGVDAATGTDALIVGGWREGSDPNQYTATGAYAAGWLLAIHELYPTLVGDSALNIPEHDNGWPDLLDEAQWQVMWLLNMQRDDGGVYHKVATADSGDVAMDDEKPIARVVYPPATASTAAACAVFAKASRLISPHDATFALSCREAALQAWRYLEQHPENQPFSNPEGVMTKSYSDLDDTDERMWAALELFLLTQDESFHEILMARMEYKVPLIASAGYWANPTSIVVATMLANPDIEWDEDLQEEMHNDLELLADSLVDSTYTDGFFVSLEDDQYTWGSNGSLIQNAVMLCLAYHTTNDTHYLDAAQEQVHAILGRNPMNTAYVVGWGDRPVTQPFQSLTVNGEPLAPWPGVLVGGPNPGLNDPVLKARFSEETPAALCYADDPGSFASNEYSIEWNAAWLFLLSSLDALVN